MSVQLWEIVYCSMIVSEECRDLELALTFRLGKYVIITHTNMENSAYGISVGSSVGFSVGSSVGMSVGFSVGNSVGVAVGVLVYILHEIATVCVPLLDILLISNMYGTSKSTTTGNTPEPIMPMPNWKR